MTELQKALGEICKWPANEKFSAMYWLSTKQVNLLAPHIERALRAAARSAYSDGHNDAMGIGPCEGSEDRGVAAGVAALTKEGE